MVDYPLGTISTIGSVPMAYEEMVAYEDVNVTYDFKCGLFLFFFCPHLFLAYILTSAYSIRYP